MNKFCKKLLVFLATSALCFNLFGCGNSNIKKDNSKNNAKTEQSQDSKMNIDNWDELVKSSKGKKINMYMWGGSEEVNKYIDNWVSPKLKEKYDISLKRVPLTDAKDMVNKLLSEKQVNKKDGTIDFCWINGENFKAAKSNKLLWRDFEDKLPNYKKYIDDKSKEQMNLDFGIPTDGLEAPWGRAQFVFVYNADKVKNPPKSMIELKEWVKKNPGKFTYPAPPDFTGSAFVRQCLLETCGGNKNFPNKIDMNKFNEDTKPLWSYLNDIKPYLWRQGKTYPESSGKLDTMYGKGEVWMAMSYNPFMAYSKIEKGTFPKNTKTYVLDKGTLCNTHYLSIPFNSPNKDAAMVAINFLLSPDAQLEKLNPSVWGDGTVLSSDKLNKEQKDKLNSLTNKKGSIPTEVLEKHRIPEISSSYVDIIEKGWMENVSKK